MADTGDGEWRECGEGTAGYGGAAAFGCLDGGLHMEKRRGEEGGEGLVLSIRRGAG